MPRKTFIRGFSHAHNLTFLAGALTTIFHARAVYIVKAGKFFIYSRIQTLLGGQVFRGFCRISRAISSFFAVYYHFGVQVMRGLSIHYSLYYSLISSPEGEVSRPGGTAIPGQLVERVKQASNSSPSSTN